jgi:Fungal chitosanase of glycosyl hydrolase group 75
MQRGRPMNKTLALAAISALAVLATSSPHAADVCPFVVVPQEKLAGRLEGLTVQSSSDPIAFVFASKLERDDDGGPNAYHIGYKGISVDPGLDHICNGGSVLEYKDGSLVDKYYERGSIGSLSGTDPTTTWSRSALCKQDYINLRDAGFPSCGPNNLCMIWYGIASTRRACGYPNGFDGANDLRCGVPIRQQGPNGVERAYYLTQTALRRPGASESSLQQSDYANANALPFIVLPGGFKLPDGVRWSVGDVALVFWKSSVVAAVVGDTGPSGKLGEGSRELLRELRGNSSATIDGHDFVITVLLPGTASQVLGD